MFSLEYAQRLLPEISLLDQVEPCLLSIQDVEVINHQLNRIRKVRFLDYTGTRIGRDPHCEIVLRNPFISRIHAVVTPVSTSWGLTYWIEDGDGLGKASANGVFVNQKPIRAAVCLYDRDRLRFGSQVTAIFHEIRDPSLQDIQSQEALGDLLEEAGLISTLQLAMAREIQQQSHLLLGEILMEQQWIQPETVEFFMSHYLRTQPQLTRKHLIGEYLKLAGLVNEEQIVEALRIQRRQKIYFGTALVKQGYIRPETINFFLKRAGALES